MNKRHDAESHFKQKITEGYLDGMVVVSDWNEC